MFKKILIADDFDSQNLGVRLIIQELNIPIIDSVYYCDNAIAKIKESYAENKPYELLITDLSFLADNKKQKITGGEELISEVKKRFPETKIIVFSVENRSYMINRLIDHYDIDGFVIKGRKDEKELKKAINFVYQGITFFPDIANTSNVCSISENDMTIIKLLVKGLRTNDISEHFKKNGIIPNSESYIDKRLLTLRQEFSAKNTSHLLTILADANVI